MTILIALFASMEACVPGFINSAEEPKNLQPGQFVDRQFVNADGDSVTESFGRVLEKFDGNKQQRCQDGEGVPIQQKVAMIEKSTDFICSNDPVFSEDQFTVNESIVPLNMDGNATDGYCHVAMNEYYCPWIKISSL